MTAYALQGLISRELLTLNGRILTHPDRTELEFLITGATPIPLPPSIPPDQTVPLRFHPDMAAIRWPLRREDFQ